MHFPSFQGYISSVYRLASTLLVSPKYQTAAPTLHIPKPYTSFKMSITHILAFPDQHADLLGAMYDLNVRSKTRSQLRTFLSAAAAVVHEYVDSLDRPERARVGSFEDLVDLAERFAKQDHPSVVAEIVLFTTVQMGQLLM
jgi:hypothetical protein